MKRPSTSIGRSLRGQPAPAREEPPPEISELREGGPSMVASGEGGVALPAGALREQGSRASRSAANFAAPMRRFGGLSVTGE
jgi:hypothetical protein